MRPLSVVTGPVVPLDRADVDTDQIMPKQHLKRIERTGFGELVFGDWRADPDFVLNDGRYAGAAILVTGANFGSGSSREHAPWGLQQYGFDVVIAPSFADIFRSNSAKIGLLCIALDAATCQRLVATATGAPGISGTVDLPAQRVVCGEVDVPFAIDGHTKRVLVEGLDDIAMTLSHAGAITAYEAARPAWLPVTTSR